MQVDILTHEEWAEFLQGSDGSSLCPLPHSQLHVQQRDATDDEHDEIWDQERT